MTSNDDKPTVDELRAIFLRRFGGKEWRAYRIEKFLDYIIERAREEAGLDAEDFAFMVHNTSLIIDRVTNGRASKPMIYADVVGELVDERIEAAIADALEDDAEIESDRRRHAGQ